MYPIYNVYIVETIILILPAINSDYVILVSVIIQRLKLVVVIQIVECF